MDAGTDFVCQICHSSPLARSSTSLPPPSGGHASPPGLARYSLQTLWPSLSSHCPAEQDDFRFGHPTAQVRASTPPGFQCDSTLMCSCSGACHVLSVSKVPNGGSPHFHQTRACAYGVLIEFEFSQ